MVIVAVVLGVTACEPAQPDTVPPSWGLHDRAWVETLGPYLALSWSPASGNPTRYRIDVNGTSVPVTDATKSGCVLVGLQPLTTYTIRVTAYDAAGNWSDTLPPDGRHDPGYRSLDGTTASSAIGGGTRRCVPTADDDADRIPDALELGPGSGVHPPNLQTRPGDGDSDDDGLLDGDEVFGTESGLNLPALGVRPLAKDVLVEVDWASQITGCNASLQPTAAWIDPVRQAFADMPVSGIPGGSHIGVKLIVDYGQGGHFTGGNAIPDADGRLNGDPVGTLARTENFAPNRVGYFHYASISTQVNVAGVWDEHGVGDVGGDEFKLGVGCNAYGPSLLSSFFMHELGHNLGLEHGGHEGANRKPNYSSVMNYRYMSAGADGNCDGRPDLGLLEYSDEVRQPVDENRIDEVAGMCPGISADIDLDGLIDPLPYAFDVNGGGRTVLHGSDDFDHIDFAAFAEVRNDPQRAAQKTEVYCELPAP